MGYSRLGDSNDEQPFMHSMLPPLPSDQLFQPYAPTKQLPFGLGETQASVLKQIDTSRWTFGSRLKPRDVAVQTTLRVVGLCVTANSKAGYTSVRVRVDKQIAEEVRSKLQDKEYRNMVIDRDCAPEDGRDTCVTLCIHF
jgi:hypothetical protein